MSMTMHLLVPREDWGALEPRKPPLALGPVKRIIVHRSETPDSDPFSPHLRTASIQDHHMRVLGWDDIGYHILIGQGGEIVCGRPLSAQGAHVAYLNKGSIGVCVLCKKEPTLAQTFVLGDLLDWGCAAFNLPPDAVLGHGDVRDTDCPGQVLTDYLSRWREDNQSEDNGQKGP